MRPTDLFIRRPVLAIVVNLLVLLLGVRALQTMTVRQYPQTKYAVVTVTTVYVGASANLVQGFITTPLEASIATANGIDYLQSTSVQGVSIITATLQLNYDPNAALTQITSKVNAVRNQLPPEAEVPTIDVTVGESTASMYLSFYSKQLKSNQITDYLTRVVQPELVAVSGVQQAQILGARTIAMRIWLDPKRMAALGITPNDVHNVLAAQNFLSAAGSTKGEMVAVSLTATTELHTADQFRKLVVKQEDNTIVRLGDIARVELGAEDYDTSVIFDGQQATFIGVTVAPGANPLDVIGRIKKLFPSIVAALPPGLHARIVYDATDYIHDAIREVVGALVEAVLIVVVVIFLFLGSVRSITIPVVAIPLALIGGGFIMLLLGYSINLLTLLAMVLAIGLVVDDAIIVVENVHRHIEEGMRRLDAALIGARELAGPVAAMTITLVAVYAPIGFMGGLTGALFSEFAYTLAGTVLVSGFVALTLSPMMCSRVLPRTAAKKGLAHWLDRGFEWGRRLYVRLLTAALGWRWPVLTIAGLVLASNVFFYRSAKRELAPTEDQGILLVQFSGAANASSDQLKMWSGEMNGIFKSFPQTAHYFILNGLGATATAANTGFGGMVLKPWSERNRTTMQLQPILQMKLGQIAGLQAVAFQRPPLPGARGLPVEFVIGTVKSPQALYEVSQRILQRARQSGLFLFADSDLKYDRPQVVIQIDRDKAAALGLNMQQVGADLAGILGGNYVNYFSIEGRSYKVIPQVERSQRLNPDQLKNYYVRTSDGSMVPLSTIVSLKTTVEPEQLLRFQQLNAATISAVPRPGVTLGQALSYLQKQAREVFPAGYRADYAGQSRQYFQEGGTLLVTFFFAIIIIYLVLAALFESFRDPIIMLVTVPMSISGALLFLALGLATLNIYTEVGLVTLIGLISKHGILIVQFANQLARDERLDRKQAVIKAAGIRLRPILMTTAATVLGVVPLLLAKGPGAVSRFDIGLVIATGMMIGTAFTLFVVPAMYTLLARRHAAESAPPAPGDGRPSGADSRGEPGGSPHRDAPV